MKHVASMVIGTKWKETLWGMVMLTALLFAQSAQAQPTHFADMVEKYQRTVVNISTQRVFSDAEEIQAPEAMPRTPFEGTPFENMFRDFFESMPMQPTQRMPEQSLGSGVVLSADGYIVTNSHVVAAEGADIIVKVEGDSREYKAKVIGTDPKNDLAVLKIDAKGLQVAPLADSSKLRVGEWVVAIGNPFGLSSSVSAGIVSALGRNIHQGPYDDFIQTDAAINPGNSGGPLFNMQGEVVGINTAILSRSGGYQGIGFAIPINTVKLIVDQIKQHGRPIRGWLGVQIQTVTPDLADVMAMKEPYGALVAEVMEGSPAAIAGIQSGDVIIYFDARRIREMSELPKLVAETAIGKTVDVVLLRSGKERTLKVKILELEEAKDVAATAPKADATKPDGIAGMTLKPLNQELRKQMGLESTLGGLAVMNVRPASAAAKAGLLRGDVIMKAGSRDINAVADLEKALKASKGKTLLLVKRAGNNLFVALTVEKNGK